MRARPGAALGLAALLLGGCGGSSPADELAERADAVTRAANAGDAAAFRSATDALADTVSVQRDAEQLDAGQAQRLLTLTAALRRQAADVDPQTRAATEAAARQAAAEAAARTAAARAAAERAAAEQAAAQQAAAERAAAERAAAEQAAARQPEPGEDEADDKGKGKGKGGKD